jgi:GGDEF domain-containing protein
MTSLRSLKSYLTGPEETGTLRRVISILMQGIMLHAVEGDRADFNMFRDHLERIEAPLGKCASAGDLLIAASAINQALADHGKRTTRFIRQQGAVLQNMISMLTQTMVTIGAGSERSAEHLQAIERELGRADMIEDIRTLKLRLGECLKNLRQEVVRQKAQALRIQEQVEHAQHSMDESSDPDLGTDPATGLQTRLAAKAALQEALHRPGRKYVVIEVVNGLQSINRRFGYPIGDQLLKTVSDLFGDALTDTDRLFRWHGPALVALVEREKTIDAVRAEIGRINSKRITGVLEVGKDRLLLPVSAAWQVLPLTSSAVDITKAIETFIASQLPTGED